MKFFLNNRIARKLLFYLLFLVFSFSMSYAQEYEHTLLKPYGFDMLATKSKMLSFLSDFEIEPRMHYDSEIYLATIEPSNQSILEDLNLDYGIVFFKDEIMAMSLFRKDDSYRNFLIKQYNKGEQISRNDSESEFKWEIGGYTVHLVISNSSDFFYHIRSINVNEKYDFFLKEKAKIDPYF